MRVVSIELRDFRSYERAEAYLGAGLTVVSGRNGAGKTNLLEAIYFASTGRSCRTTNDREVVRFEAEATRVHAHLESDDGGHTVSVGFAPGEAKRMAVDGVSVDRLIDHPGRPLMSVFLPDRLELVKGAPALRRAHLDQLVAALWPARIATRRAYNQVLAQRNALLARLRNGIGSRNALAAWDEQLAVHGVDLMRDRAAAAEMVAPKFVEMCTRLGLNRAASLTYRPRSSASEAAGFIDELQQRLDGDIERGFTGYGPHRDDMLLVHEGKELRMYGSQGQQRIGLLALLLAERRVIGRMRCAAPMLLLDDVMSELDSVRRSALVEVVADHPGQVVMTTTELEHVPGSDSDATTHIVVDRGGGLVELAGLGGSR